MNITGITRAQLFAWGCILSAIHESIERENFTRLCIIASFDPNLVVCNCGNPHFASSPVSSDATYTCAECAGLSNGDTQVPSVKLHAEPFSVDALPEYLQGIIQENTRNPLDVAGFIRFREQREAKIRRHKLKQRIAVEPVTKVERDQILIDASYCAAPNDDKGLFRAFTRLLYRAKRKKFIQRDAAEQEEKREERARKLLLSNERLSGACAFAARQSLWTPRRDECLTLAELHANGYDPEPLESVILRREVVDCLKHPERDTDDAPTSFYMCWQNRLELELIRDVWQRIEEEIKRKRDETVARALYDILVADMNHIWAVALKYSLDVRTLYNHVRRVCTAADVYGILRKSFVSPQMTNGSYREREEPA